jgi:transposase-like protein
MKKRTQNSSAQQGRLARRRDDDEFKQQALAMGRNGQSARSVAEAPGISGNLIHRWKRAARAKVATTGRVSARPWAIEVRKTLSGPIIKEQKQMKTLARGQERVYSVSDTPVR